MRPDKERTKTAPQQPPQSVVLHTGYGAHSSSGATVRRGPMTQCSRCQRRPKSGSGPLSVIESPPACRRGAVSRSGLVWSSRLTEALTLHCIDLHATSSHRETQRNGSVGDEHQAVVSAWAITLGVAAGAHQQARRLVRGPEQGAGDSVASQAGTLTVSRKNEQRNAGMSGARNKIIPIVGKYERRQTKVRGEPRYILSGWPLNVESRPLRRARCPSEQPAERVL